MTKSIKICLMVVIAVVCLNLFISQTEAIPLETTSEVTESIVKTSSDCAEGNPCGWAVYGNSKTKKTQYFIRNTCRCLKEHSCILSNEDLSLTAYVYRCKSKNPPSDV